MIEIEIKKKNPHFAKIALILKAVRTEDGLTKGICYLLVTDEHIVATDGQRMHIGKNVCCWQAGSYKIEKANTREIKLSRENEPPRFPDWEKVVPDYSERFTYKRSNFDEENLTAAIIKITNCTVQHVFLREILMHTEGDIVVSFTRNDRPIILDVDNIRCVLMPLKK